jgi:preprotein translocase subunit SecB
MASAPETPTQGNGFDPANPPQVGILAQFVKDLSFENPNAPQSLQFEGAPRIEINVGVNAKRADDQEMFEVHLKVEARAFNEDTPVFVVDLLYVGLFVLRNIPTEALEPFLVVEAPRLLFPFARRVIADATRDGGFPPLLLEPIDFGALYMQQRQGAQGAAGGIVGNA